MHLFGGTQDGIHGAGLYAQCATNTQVFFDQRDPLFFMFTVIFIQRFGFSIEKISQCLDSACPPGWALVDVRLTAGNCLGIGMTACKAALATLCLG
jgi:hypothetical protein